MSPSTEGLIGLVLAAGILGVGAPAAIRLWRNESRAFNDPEALNRWGSPHTARAVRRAFPVTIFGVALTACAWAALIVGSPTNIVTGVFLLSAGLCALIGWLIVLVNRPKTLVPPHLRGEPGLLRASRGG